MITTRPGTSAGTELRLTLLDVRTGRRQDVAVSAPEGATVADLLDASRALGLPEAGPVTVEGRIVEPHHPLGVPPLLHGCVLAVEGDGLSARAREPSVDGVWSATGLHLDVVSGPDAGWSRPLTPGQHVLGRFDPADVRIHDDQVSRRHAVLTVEPGGVTVCDAGSTNGTWVTGPETGPGTRRGAVGQRPQPLPAGSGLLLGHSRVELRVPGCRPARRRPDGSGSVEVNRPPRSVVPRAPVVLEAPVPPPTAPPLRVPWAAMALPLVLSLAAAWFLRQPTYLVFGLMSPLVLAGTALADRLGGRRRRRTDRQSWRARVVAAERRAQLALTEERARLRHVVGDPAALTRAARLPSARVWERTARCEDLLLVSVGTGQVRSAIARWDCDEPSASAAGTASWTPPALVMDDAPITISLLEQGHLGMCGCPELVHGLARWVLGQLVVWHGPDVVQILVATSGRLEAWHWTRWLPHLTAAVDRSRSGQVTTLDEILRRRRLQSPPDRSPARLVVVLAGADLAHEPGFAAALADGPEIGVHVICLAQDARSLPSHCGAVVEIDGGGGLRLTTQGSVQRGVVDSVREGWAETLARTLAPLVDATPAPGRLPSSVPLLGVLPVDGTDAGALASSWRQQPRSTRVVLGLGVNGPVHVDLVADGPHALVAGTTGSGKSELLRSLVVSLAVANRPDELTFLLVDYKGGAAFGGCAHLVHTTGLVTDLDDQLAARALDSLESELRRREQLLHDAGCRDVAEYQTKRDADAGLPPMPRLVIVVDEFRVLATELPAFLDGVVRVASVGRSLGVHLVLATQRPAGVVTADIKANVNLRICLRVRDRIDSDDVLDVGDAAAISPDTPGRALLRRGGDAAVPLQVARLEGRLLPVDRVEVQSWDGTPTGGRPTSDDELPDGGASADLDRVVRACRAAASALSVPAPPPVWTPPLPPTLPLDAAEAADAHVPAGSAVVGLVDLPQEQRQRCLSWHPVDDGHLAVAGAARTGRTSALLTIAAGLCRRWSPADLHLHVIEASGRELQDLTALPHAGTVVSGDQPRRVTRLIQHLGAEVARRRQHHAARRAALVLLVDGWEPLVDRLADVDHGRPVDDLLALMRDGESVGLRVVLTGGRGVLVSRVAAVVGQRLLLRPNDTTDLLLAGIPPSCVPTRQPPGRALRPDGAQVQIALPPAARDVVRAATARHPAWRDQSRDDRPLRLRALPAVVPATDLLVSGRPASWALVGCGGDDHEPVGIDLAVDRFVLVAGPPGSGRTTALATMAHSLHVQGTPVVAVCGTSSPLAGGPWPTLQLGHAGSSDALAALTGAGGVVVVDDVEQLLDHPLGQALQAVTSDPRRGLVVAGSTAALSASYRGLAGLGRTSRTGVLLRPESPADGEVLGVRAQLDDASPAGRGLLVVRGRQVPVQVAMTHVTADAKTEGDLSVSGRTVVGWQ